MIAQSPQVYCEGEDIICTVGAMIYKNKSYIESMETLLTDIRNDNVDYSELLGQFTAILFSNKKIKIICDSMCCKHVFTDTKYSFFSSSLFAAAAALGQVTINEDALLEKMLTGIIVSPDTMVNEVIQINKNTQNDINKAGGDIEFLLQPQRKIPAFHNCGRAKSAEIQAENIRTFMDKWKAAIMVDRIDIGLSAGHDSSLLLAAVYPSYHDILHIHTHSTGHVHDVEKAAAVNMAHAKGLDCLIIPTPRFDELEDDTDVSKLLNENLFFFRWTYLP